MVDERQNVFDTSGQSLGTAAGVGPQVVRRLEDLAVVFAN